MSQNDFSLANADGATFRADLNNAIQAAVTKSSGTGAPSTTYQFQDWYDLTTNLKKERNSGNSQWLTVGSQGTGGFIPYSNGAPIDIPNIGTATPNAGVDYLAFSVAGTGAHKKAPLYQAGRIVGMAGTQVGSASTGTGAIPADNTTPQITEGNALMSLNYAPVKSTNKVAIEVTAHLSHSAANSTNIVTLFNGTAADAIAVGVDQETSAGFISAVTFTHTMDAGSGTLALSVRGGSNQSGTMTFNGSTGTGFFNGLIASSIRVTEYVP